MKSIYAHNRVRKISFHQSNSDGMAYLSKQFREFITYLSLTLSMKGLPNESWNPWNVSFLVRYISDMSMSSSSKCSSSSLTCGKNRAHDNQMIKQTESPYLLAL
jgi:hypothetical protein